MNKRSLTAFKRTLFSIIILLFFSGALWVQESLRQPQILTSDKPVALFANQNKDDLTLAFSSAISNAKESVLLIVYSLTDPKIISSLREKSQQGISVRVISDAKASPNIDSKLGNKVTTIRRFGPGLMHQKILVIDKKQVWIGSANMTTESLRMHGNLVTVIESPLLASQIIAKAGTLKVEGRETNFPHREFIVGDQQMELWFLPDDNKAVKHLQKLIDSAEKTMRIAMFTWTRNDLAQSVIAASKRGVKVEVAIDYYSGKGASSKIVKLLKQNGINVVTGRGGSLLHHKFLYIDSKTLVNGSANWTKAAFTQNDDCFIVLHDLNIEQTERMEALWKAILAETLPVKG